MKKALSFILSITIVLSCFSTSFTGVAAIKVQSPTSVTATAFNCSQINLSWKRASSVSGYQIFRCNTYNGKYSLIGSTTGASYQNKGLKIATKYYYKLRSYKKYNNKYYYSAYTKYVCRQTKSIGAPGNFAISSVKNNSAKLSWNKNTKAKGYSLCRSTSSSSGYKCIKLYTSNTSTTFTDETLSKNTNYYYRLYSFVYNKDGSKYYSGYSQRSTKTTNYALPTDVLNVKCSAVNDVSATLTWSKAQKADFYQIINEDDSSVLVDKILTTSGVMNNLESGKSYNLSVRACTNAGAEYYYGEKSYISIVTNPSKVENVEYYVSKNNNIALTWDKSVGATGYIVKSKSTGDTVFSTTNGEKTSATISSVEQNTDDEYCVIPFVEINNKWYFGEQSDWQFATNKYNYKTFNFSTGNIDTNNGGMVTTGTHAITKDLIYLPYGTVIIAPNGYDLRLDEYNSNGTFVKEILNDRGTNGSVGDINANKFTVGDKNGMYVRFKYILWKNNAPAPQTEDSIKEITANVRAYQLNNLGATILDSSTVYQCFTNTNDYEAWPTNSIAFNSSDSKYYFAYSSKSTHTSTDGSIYFRTTEDFVNWSEPVLIAQSPGTDNFRFNGFTFANNSDMVMTVDNKQCGQLSTYRSSDNGKTWSHTDIVADGKNIVSDGCMLTKVADGTLIDSYNNTTNNTSGIIYSKDNGTTWHESTANVAAGTSEINFVEFNNGMYLAVCRTKNGFYGMISEDKGITWSESVLISSSATNVPAEIHYDSETGLLEIFYIGRFSNNAINQIVTTDNNIVDYILNGKNFVALEFASCYIGAGGIDTGYTEYVKTGDGKGRLVYYNKNGNGTSFYSISE